MSPARQASVGTYWPNSTMIAHDALTSMTSESCVNSLAARSEISWNGFRTAPLGGQSQDEVRVLVKKEVEDHGLFLVSDSVVTWSDAAVRTVLMLEAHVIYGLLVEISYLV